MGDLSLLWLNILLPILSIFIPVFATVYTVNNRIKNENRENHKPYLILNKIEAINSIDKFKYHLTPIGKNYQKSFPETNVDITETSNDINVNLIINNIGYGVASNIKFYDLYTGEQVHGTQASNKEKNQRLFTTFDIASNDTKNIQARIINLVEEIDGVIIEDHNRILCIYKDLNDNIYNFIISIHIKSKGYYDFSAYQQSSSSYKRLIKEHKKDYREIRRKYTNL
ncbi:MAG: hypothetical protein PHD10_00060 [Bacilli bacterium]|nr:hypothetical protein [Bacilli bacterium]MDD4607515.1 hypothetical protein [Bacilli bacterium]